MTLDTIINVVLLLITALTAMYGLRQYIEQKDAQEQAREVSIYLICLYDTKDNKWNPLKICPQGSSEETESMHFGIVIENNSNQPIRNLKVDIDEKAFDKYNKIASEYHNIKNMTIAKRIGHSDNPPIKLIPPGKWVISVDETSLQGSKNKLTQGMNLLEDLIKYENAGYVPVVRTEVEGIKNYYFIDHLGHQWQYTSEIGGKLRKIKRRRSV